MPKTTKPPSYRLHKSSGQAVVTLNGKAFYLGRHNTKASRCEFDRLISEWLANGRCLPRESGDEFTVIELMAAYKRFAERYYSKGGQTTPEVVHIVNAMRALKPGYGPNSAASFGPLALKAVRQQLVDRGLSRKHVNDQVGRIRRMFKWGVENELAPPAVYHGLQAVAGLKRGRSEARETEPVRPVPDEYVDAIQPFVSAQVWAMVELQRLTGMRSGEVVIMRGRDLDTTGSIWLYQPESHKTQHHGHERIVELGPRAQAMLKPFLKPDLDAHLFSPRDAVADQQVEKRRGRKSKVQPSQRNRSRPNRKERPASASRRTHIDARSSGLAMRPMLGPGQN